jgi:hypothetical protein
VHVPSWLTSGQQQWIAGQFREWVRGPVPARAAKVRGLTAYRDEGRRLAAAQAAGLVERALRGEAL